MAQYLNDLAAKLNQIILPIIMILGIIGNSSNIFILTRINLRNHSCSKYFLALASNNLIHSFYLIYYLLRNGYSIHTEYVSLSVCRITQYIGVINSILSPYFIVLASIDRFCASSSNVNLRKFSNVRMARWSILILVSFCLLLFINTLVLTDLRNDGYGCNIRPNNIYNQIFIILPVLLFAGIAPCLMIIFGLLTIYNINQTRILTQMITHYRRTEGQLARMLLLQVIVYIILNIPLCIMYLILVLPTGYVPTTLFFFIQAIVSFLYNFSYCTPFFLYILSGRIYREELIRLFLKISRIRIQIQIQPITTSQDIRLKRLTPQTIPNTYN